MTKRTKIRQGSLSSVSDAGVRMAADRQGQNESEYRALVWALAPTPSPEGRVGTRRCQFAGSATTV
jgi:hypothetical protein